MSAFDPTRRMGTPPLGRPPRRRPAVQRGLALLGPDAQPRPGRLPRRFAQVLVRLAHHGLTLATTVRATLGNSLRDMRRDTPSGH
jgi:hypothetical protein